MDKCFLLLKERFHDFFERMQSFGEIQAPVRVSNQSFAYKKVDGVDEIAFGALRTILPPKKFFYPQRETLFTFDGENINLTLPEEKRIVLFGAHPCDLAGLRFLDKIFTAEPGDVHYQARKNSILIVGLSCMPDKHCFCKSMGTDSLSGGYDLFLTDIGAHYFLQVATPLGASILHDATFLEETTVMSLAEYQDFWRRRESAFEIGFDSTNLKPTMDTEFNHPVWEELANRCLSCGNCVPVCPTCYCFDMVDSVDLTGESGERVREWDACQFNGFAEVAGGFNFRPGPIDRLKFWYRHKLHGFDDAAATAGCVGCGRCTVSCPSGIDDIVGTVLRLQGQPVVLQFEKQKDDPHES